MLGTLTAISGYCGLLLDEELGPLTQEQREVLGRMQHSSTRLSRIANSMFQLSTRLHGDEEMNFENADIQDCVDQACTKSLCSSKTSESP